MCTGFFGCLKCYQKGITFKTENNGSVLIFPYNNYIPSGPKRNNEKYMKDLLALKRGVKRYCKFSRLKYYKTIKSTGIDYMHSVCLGVVKKLLEYLFSSKYSKQHFSLYKYIDEIDKILLKIRTPKFIPKAPRSLKNIAIWKSNEYLSFLIYYALPLLRGYMSLDQFNHLINLSVAMEY